MERTGGQGYRTIVVGTDGTTTAADAVRRAATIARVSGARLHLACAYRPDPDHQVRVRADGAPDDVAHTVTNHDGIDAMLEEVAASVAAEGLATDLHAVEGEPHEALIELARQLDAELIVVGNRRMQGLTRHVLGSVPDAVSHAAPCDVLIVHTT